MMDIGIKQRERLDHIKKQVKNAYDYFKPNYDRYNAFRKFVFDTSISADDRTKLVTLNKAQIEFNIMEAYLSRLCGEFSKQEPSVEIMADDGDPVDPKTLDVVLGHVKHIIDEAKKDGTQYHTYRDALSGGFSVLKVFTEYSNPMSFNQVIKVRRAFDPQLCGFDPMARAPHKGDGRFCFELFPKSKEEFAAEYPEIDISNIKFTRNFQGFSWSYTNTHEEVVLMCDYYEKKKTRKRICRLVNGAVMTTDEYKKFVEEWNASGRIEQVPAMMGKPRWTEIETICRYRLIESEIIDYIETDYPMLPLVFVDGNSAMIREGKNQQLRQMTRPYIYHAKGAQQLKNFAGQALATELESMVMHKFIIKKEAIPDEKVYQDALSNVQLANTMVVKAFKDNDPNVPIPDPIREVNRIPAPPEVTNAFAMTDQITQTILGSYDAALGINDNQLSGIAIVEGATQSNAAAMPYVVNYMHSWNQVVSMFVAMMPMYYATPRTIPIIGKDNKRGYQQINSPGQPAFNYDENALQVKVEAGVNFAIQKSRALQQIIALSQASQIFGEFINNEGIEVLLDNIEIKGVDQLKDKVAQFQQRMQQMQQQQQKMQQQEAQNNPAMMAAQLKAQQLQQENQKMQMDNELKKEQLEVDREKIAMEKIKIAADIAMSHEEAKVEALKADTERFAKEMDVELKKRDLAHTHASSIAEHHHRVRMDREQPRA